MILVVYVLLLIDGCSLKYLEGELKTNDNWAFMARFCFLSEEGQFEYYIEYNEDQGEPNLLLYYDADDQWPAVYKTSKTCAEREAVLKMDQNQIVNLTIRHHQYRESSGCSVSQLFSTTPRHRYTISVPTLPTRRHSTTPATTGRTTEAPAAASELASASTGFESSSSTEGYLEEFNETNSRDINLDFESIFDEQNYTNDYNGTTKAPIRKRALKKTPKYEVYTRQGRTIVCHNARRFRSSRERWWFVAISNCKGNKGINVKYKIHMTNGPPGDYWHEQFSADEFYILPVLMAFSLAYSLLILGIVMCSIELKSRQLLHSTYKLFVLSVFLQFFGILLESMAYLKYAVHGMGTSNVKMFGEMFMGCSETCFLLLLVLLAKGYTVTRGRLSLSCGIKLTIFMCIYVITYISLFIYEAKVFDPGEVLYLYESPAGYGLIILRIFGWCMFIYSTVVTLKRYPEKANFYYPFNICGTLWFIAGPAFILSANSYIDKWVRESIVCAVLLFITFGGHLMFLLLTMPSVANKNFPYHVRTTQIGVMELTGTSGVSTIEQFSHHVYEPTSNMEQTVIIPLTRRTEEIFGGIYSQHLRGTLRRSQSRDREDCQVQNGRDVAMENVINWSLAKNLPVLEIGHFDRLQPNGLDSPDFRDVNNRRNFEGSMRRTSSPNLSCPDSTNQSPKHNLDEWVKDVPVELFTVSKMVVTKNKSDEAT